MTSLHTGSTGMKHDLLCKRWVLLLMKIAYSVKGTEAMNLERYFVTNWFPNPC